MSTPQKVNDAFAPFIASLIAAAVLFFLIPTLIVEPPDNRQLHLVGWMAATGLFCTFLYAAALFAAMMAVEKMSKKKEAQTPAKKPATEA
ncbi:MAG TPA: hypothetical protein VJH75_04210 [Patescibacteria group bacterium]|nr:hypothetical protein [Patescibacteria group bacterium]